MAEPADMIVPLLQEMRSESSANFAAIDARIAAVEKRLSKMDESLVTFRHALTGDTMLGRIFTGEIEERLEIIERRLRELETHK